MCIDGNCKNCPTFVCRHCKQDIWLDDVTLGPYEDGTCCCIRCFARLVA